MRCKQAQARIDDLTRGFSGDTPDRELQAHLAECAACSELERARRVIETDLAHVSAEAGRDPLTFDNFRERVHNRLDSGTKDLAVRRTGHRGVPRLAFRIAAPIVTLAVLSIIALVSFDRTDDAAYQITVAGIDESIVVSGNLQRLFDAVGLPDVDIATADCNPLCLLKITGLYGEKDTRLAVAALQAVPNASIKSVGTFRDKVTGKEIVRTTVSSKLDITEARWDYEVSVDSGAWQRVSIALDSLTQDTTFSLETRVGEDKDSHPKEEYTVHPDGSYTQVLRTHPAANLGWTESSWTFDSTGALISRAMVDTQGVSHDIDIRNGARAEEQLKEVGMFSIIAYDDSGVPWYTSTNQDPSDIPGYGPQLAPGMFLAENDPNPFDSVTRIAFGLPERAHVTMKIYGHNSRLVRTLVDSTLSAGVHSVVWDARDDEGRRVRAFRWLCKLEVGEYFHTIKMYQVWE